MHEQTSFTFFDALLLHAHKTWRPVSLCTFLIPICHFHSRVSVRLRQSRRDDRHADVDDDDELFVCECGRGAQQSAGDEETGEAREAGGSCAAPVETRGAESDAAAVAVPHPLCACVCAPHPFLQFARFDVMANEVKKRMTQIEATTQQVGSADRRAQQFERRRGAEGALRMHDRLLTLSFLSCSHVQSGAAAASTSLAPLLQSSYLHLLELKAVSRSLTNLAELTKTQLHAVNTHHAITTVHARTHDDATPHLRAHSLIICCLSVS